VFVSFPKLCLIGAIIEGIYRSGRLDNPPKLGVADAGGE